MASILLPKEFVIVQSAVMHVGARVMPEQDSAGKDFWLTTNIMGTFLPQCYRAKEISLSTEASIRHHGLCVPCWGWGATDNAITGQQAVCDECGGSGRNGMTVTHTRVREGMKAHMKLELAVVLTIECELCRNALLPKD